MTQKRAIVMGATSGIGMRVALELAERGWAVGIAGRRQNLLDETAARHPNIIATQCIDITADDAANELMALVEKMGGMDLYFHSSGIGYQNPSLDVQKELSTLQTNVVGFSRMLIAAFEYFCRHPERTGHIAAISSIAGTKGLGAAPAYSSSKRFCNHYLECLSQLCAIRRIGHIRIHDIRPGFVRTALLADGKYPLQLDPDKVARNIVKRMLKGESIITVDWRYRLLVGAWRLIPRWIWIKMRISS